MVGLHEYQKRCVTRILEQDALPLFLKPGLGKTVITLAGIEGLRLIGDASRVLVIAPLRPARHTWPAEAEKFNFKFKISLVLGSAAERIKALQTDADIYIINVDNVVWLVEQFNYIKRWPFDVVVIDELSTFKSPGSKRFRALRQVRPRIKRIIGLTGTPASNGLIDLWSQMYLMDRGERLEPFVTRYRTKYFVPSYGSGSIVYQWNLRDGAKEQIHAAISDIAVSMGDEYLNLPPRTDNVIDLEFDGKTRKAYRDFIRDRVIEMGGNAAIVAQNAAVLSGKLLQFTSGAIYDTDQVARQVHDIKIEALRELIDELQQEPIIVYYAFRHERDRIKRAVPEARDLLDDNIQAFQRGEIPVILAHPQSAGHGLNLQDNCATICWFTVPNGSLELYIQANARIDRQGQKRPVQIHHLIVSDTWDVRALNLLRGKNAEQKDLLEAVKLECGVCNEYDYSY